jgi:peptide/nickel transport system substrate-binding protein
MRRNLAQAAALVGCISWFLSACETPARVTPWRTAPDPTAVANVDHSPALTAAAEVSEIHAARPHTLRIAMDSDPGRLFPMTASQPPSQWARRITVGPVFETLLRAVPSADGSPGTYGPRLARSWRVMPGGLEIRVELEPGVTFHDGHSLTTVDVQFTLDSIRDPKRRLDHLRSMLEDVDAIELITATQVRLRLHRPSAWALRALAEIPILPMHIYKDAPNGGGSLVGSGPWRLTSNKGGVVHLSRYDKYWGGPAKISDIEFFYQSDAAVVLTAAKRGDVDVVSYMVPAHWPEQASAPGVSAQFLPLMLNPPTLRMLVFNVTKPPLDRVEVRHALALLIDRQSIAKSVFDGLKKPVLWPIWQGGPMLGPDTAAPQFDPAAAAALLTAAGWIDSDKDGLRDQNGEKLKVTLVAVERTGKDPSLPGQATEREKFVEASRRAGVIIDVRTGSESTVEKRLKDGDFGVAIVEWHGMTDSDMRPLLGTGGSWNFGRFSDVKIDKILADMAQRWDPGDRAKAALDIISQLNATWPIAGIVADAPQGLLQRRVKGVVIGDGWFDLTQVSLAE